MLLEPGPQRYEDLIPESDSRIGSAMTARAFAHSSKWFLPATVQRHFSVRWSAESEEKIRRKKHLLRADLRYPAVGIGGLQLGLGLNGVGQLVHLFGSGDPNTITDDSVT